MIRDMVLECSCGLVGRSTEVIGRMGKCMEKAKLLKMGSLLKVNGKMERKYKIVDTGTYFKDW